MREPAQRDRQGHRKSCFGQVAVLAVLRWERSGYRLQTLLLLTGTAAAALFAGIAVRNRRTALAAATERGERRERERHQQALLDLAADRGPDRPRDA